MNTNRESRKSYGLAIGLASIAAAVGLALVSGANGAATSPAQADSRVAATASSDASRRGASPDQRGASPDAPLRGASPDPVERGAYLARVGNCMGCHTEAGAPEYAGGRGIETPFGVIFAPNLTPAAKTGIGTWSSDDFWNAMHDGRSKDGRLLYPAFPYPYYTLVTREDSDAIFAFLRTLPAVERENKPHALRFPYNKQASLAVWRLLSFEPAAFAADPSQSAEWNRGAYLVRGLGHCGACHSPRNILGASVNSAELGGAALPSGDWYAPSLMSESEAGVAGWELEQIVELLKNGTTAHATTLGPMAEVVFRSTQFVSDADLRAMAVFLKSLPQDTSGESRTSATPEVQTMDRGRATYAEHCAQCHGDTGEGAPSAYSALADNRAVTMETPVNVVRIVLDGGFAPATAGNPRPYGMPPFSHVLNDEALASVVTYIRNAWGNSAPPVTALDVMRQR